MKLFARLARVSIGRAREGVHGLTTWLCGNSSTSMHADRARSTPSGARNTL